jgi:hypothetical protein
MSVIVIKPYIPKGSLLSKIARDISPVFINPKFDPNTMTFKIGDKKYPGKRSNSADPDSEIICEIPEVGMVLSDQSIGIPISPNQMFDTENIRDMFVLNMAMHSGFVAESREKVNVVEGHRFFITDDERDAEKTSTKVDQVYEAISLLMEMSQDEKTDLARMLGQYVLKMSDKKINAFLKKMAMDDPGKMVSFLNDKDYKYRVFIKKLTERNILRADKGKYMYNDQLIGVDMDHVVEFVRSPKNADLVSAWGRLLNKDVTVDVAEEVVAKKGPGRPSNKE